MVLRNCDQCDEEKERKELGRKIRGKYLCKSCKKKCRENHREDTIESAGIKDELRKLQNKISSGYSTPEKRGASSRKYYKRISESKIKESPLEDFPKIKGSSMKTKRQKNNCYLTLGEKQSLFRILVKRGLSGDEAKDRIKDLISSQRELTKKLRENNKSEEEININRIKLLDELWNN